MPNHTAHLQTLPYNQTMNVPGGNIHIIINAIDGDTTIIAPDVTRIREFLGPVVDRMRGVSMAQNPPEELFQELLQQEERQRPVILILDGRETSLTWTEDWRERFQGLLEAQRHNDDKSWQAAYSPRMMLYFGEEPSAPFAKHLSELGVKWEVARLSDKDKDVKQLYQSLMYRNLSSLFAKPLADRMSQTPDPNGRPIEESMTKEERESWQQRLRSVGYNASSEA